MAMNEGVYYSWPYSTTSSSATTVVWQPQQVYYQTPTIQASYTSPKPPPDPDDPVAWLRGRIREITSLVEKVAA